MVVCAYKQQLQKPGKNDLRLLIIKSAYKISAYSLKKNKRRCMSSTNNYKQQLQKPGKNDLRLLIIKSAYKISAYSLKKNKRRCMSSTI